MKAIPLLLTLFLSGITYAQSDQISELEQVLDGDTIIVSIRERGCFQQKTDYFGITKEGDDNYLITFHDRDNNRGFIEASRARIEQLKQLIIDGMTLKETCGCSSTTSYTYTLSGNNARFSYTSRCCNDEERQSLDCLKLLSEQ